MKNKTVYTLIASLLFLITPFGAKAQNVDLQPTYSLLAQGVVAAASVSSSYTTALANTTGDIKWVDILNTCNCIIYVSFDASTDHFTVPAGSSLYLEPSRLNIKLASNVSIKYSGSACSTGSVYVAGAN